MVDTASSIMNAVEHLYDEVPLQIRETSQIHKAASGTTSSPYHTGV